MNKIFLNSLLFYSLQTYHWFTGSLNGETNYIVSQLAITKYFNCKKELPNKQFPEYCFQQISNVFLKSVNGQLITNKDIFNWLNKNLYQPLAIQVAPNFSVYDIMDDLFNMSKWSPFTYENDTWDIQNQISQLKMLIRESLILSLDSQNTGLRIKKNTVQILHQIHMMQNYLDQKLGSKRVFPIIKSLILFIFEESIKIGTSINHSKRYFQNQFMSLFQNFEQSKHLIQFWSDNNSFNYLFENLSFKVINVTQKQSQVKTLGLNELIQIANITDLARSSIQILQTAPDKNIIIQYHTKKLFDNLQIKRNIIKRQITQNQLPYFDRSMAIIILKIQLLLLQSQMSQAQPINDFFGTDIQYFQRKFNSGKLYLVFKDTFLLIPQQCQNLQFFNLQTCVEGKLKQLQDNIFQEFRLFLSISGAYLVQYISHNLRKLMLKLQQQNVYSNGLTFRNQFYILSFIFTQKILQRFGIQEIQSVNILQEWLFKLIEKLRAIKGSTQYHEKLNSIELNIYDSLVNIQSELIIQGTKQMDQIQLNQICQDLHKNIMKSQQEQSDYAHRITHGINQMCNKWKENELMKDGNKEIITPSTVWTSVPDDYKEIDINNIYNHK